MIQFILVAYFAGFACTFGYLTLELGKVEMIALRDAVRLLKDSLLWPKLLWGWVAKPRA